MLAVASAAQAQTQYDLRTDGREFLLAESRQASAFLLGELHGEREIPELIEALWPSLWAAGYRHVAAEVSDWTAERLDQGAADVGFGLWRREEAAAITRLRRTRERIIWGCDIEEVNPRGYILDLAQRSRDPKLRPLADQVRAGYRRADAPALFSLAAPLTAYPELLATLSVEATRADRARRYEASVLREAHMKAAYLRHVRRGGARPRKVFARFGRNHLHRGFDRRGVSTFGNFLAELAVSRGERTFHVAAFAGGGQIRLGGPPQAADERADDPAFAILADSARYPETLFDLRPLRAELRRVPAAERTPAQVSLLYLGGFLRRDHLLPESDAAALGVRAGDGDRHLAGRVDLVRPRARRARSAVGSVCPARPTCVPAGSDGAAAESGRLRHHRSS